jgi:hypothetical protein
MTSLKPRIVLSLGTWLYPRWLCWTPGGPLGIGTTPDEAYKEWQRETILWHKQKVKHAQH